MNTTPTTMKECIADMRGKGVEISPEAAEALEQLDPATLEQLLVNYSQSAEDSFKFPLTRKVASTFLIKGYKVRMVFRRDKGLTKISAMIHSAP